MTLLQAKLNQRLCPPPFCLLSATFDASAPVPYSTSVTARRAQPARVPVFVQLTVPILTGNPGGKSNLMKSLSLAK